MPAGFRGLARRLDWPETCYTEIAFDRPAELAEIHCAT
jgi:hypothetical protein